jgi:hypothetical protein
MNMTQRNQALKTLLTPPMPATLARISHSLKGLFDFLFDGQPPAPPSPALAPQMPPPPVVRQTPAPHEHTNGTRPQPKAADETALTVLGTDCETGEPVTISLKERLLGLYVIGATGTGKTTLDLNMILSDIHQKRGVCLVEPHNDFTRAVIAAMPEERLKDAIYLDLTDSTSSFGLNFFECPPGADVTEVAKIASFVMHVFEKVWAVGPETPRLAQVLRNTTRVLIENPGMTFSEIPLLLWEDGVREKLVRRVTNTQTKLFWSQYNKKVPRDREELTASTINKVDAYLNEPLIARIVSQSSSTIDFRRIMDEGKILLVNLSPQLEEASRLIGAVIIGRLLMAAFSLSDTPERNRRPFMLYCDEFQRFATADFATFLAEARKFKIGTTISNQTLEQLDDLNRATALQAGSLVVFRVSGDDSKVLARSFDATPQPALVGEEPIRAPVADVVSHLLRHGSHHPTIQRLVADYLIPLDTLRKKVATIPFSFHLGCLLFTPAQLLEGQRLLNEALSACQRLGRADISLHPQALLALGGAADSSISYVFKDDVKRRPGNGWIIEGFYDFAFSLGKPGYLANQQAIDYLIAEHDQQGRFDKLLNGDRGTPGAAFLTMLRTLRETMAILAKDPILVDTGQYQPKYQLRSYQDQENLVANELSSQLPNYHAKVRLLTGEHTITTRPAPPLVSEREVEARIRAIKERMLRQGYTTPAREVDEAVRKRHEQLRQRPPEVLPPTQPTGRRGRVKPPGSP